MSENFFINDRAATNNFIMIFTADESADYCPDKSIRCFVCLFVFRKSSNMLIHVQLINSLPMSCFVHNPKINYCHRGEWKQKLFTVKKVESENVYLLKKQTRNDDQIIIIVVD